MPIDATEPGSPGWWLQRLGKRLSARRAELNLLESYYRGNPPLPEGADAAREAYERFQRKARANYAKLIVEAVRQKMTVTGFRTGEEGSEESDAFARRVWQANQLDADSMLVHRSQLVMRDGYAIVGPPQTRGGLPVITPEDPRQVITEHDPIRRRKVIAALKVFHDDVQGRDVAYLYLGGRVYTATKARKVSSATASWIGSGWEWDDEDGKAIPGGLMPVVRFANDPDLQGNSAGEYEDFVDALDRINHMILQRLVIATLQAFRQRAVKGLPDVYPAGHELAGQQVDYQGLFSADPGALWQLPETAEMWESGQVDLSPVLNAVREDVKELAAVSQTPLYMLSSDAVNQSAEGASLVREGHVSKVRDRLLQAGEGWEQVMGLAFAFAGREVPPDMETLWAAPETYSLNERYSAAVQAKTAGVPFETIASEVLQFSPTQVSRMATQRADDALLFPEFIANAPADADGV